MRGVIIYFMYKIVRNLSLHDMGFSCISIKKAIYKKIMGSTDLVILLLDYIRRVVGP